MRSDLGGKDRADDVDGHRAERELVELARTDADAFASLYRAHVDRIYRFVLRRARSREVAEDVTAATFERALRGIGRFEWRPGGFAAWLHRIAANELAEHHRTASRDKTPRAQRTLRRLSEPGSGHDHAMDAVEELDAERDRQRLAEALGALSPRYQEAISLRYLAGLTPKEAAAAMGTSRGGFAVLCHRALAALRAQLELEPTVVTAVSGTARSEAMDATISIDESNR